MRERVCVDLAHGSFQRTNFNKTKESNHQITDKKRLNASTSNSHVKQKEMHEIHKLIIINLS